MYNGPKLYKEFRFGSLSIFEYKCIELRRFLAASWNWYLVPMFWCWRYRGGASRNGCLSFCSRAALAYDSIFAYIFVGLTPSCIGTSSLIRRVEKAAESALSYLLLTRLGCLATSLTSVTWFSRISFTEMSGVLTRLAGILLFIFDDLGLIKK